MNWKVITVSGSNSKSFELWKGAVGREGREAIPAGGVRGTMCFFLVLRSSRSRLNHFFFCAILFICKRRSRSCFVCKRWSRSCFTLSQALSCSGVQVYNSPSPLTSLTLLFRHEGHLFFFCQYDWGIFDAVNMLARLFCLCGVELWSACEDTSGIRFCVLRSELSSTDCRWVRVMYFVFGDAALVCQFQVRKASMV